MKRFFFFAALCVSAIVLASCEFDDSDLWQKVDEMQQQIDTNAEDIATLTALVDALNYGKVITNVEKNEEGYTLTFSDGSTIASFGSAVWISILLAFLNGVFEHVFVK